MKTKLLAVVMAGAALSACSFKLKIAVVNNSGSQATIAAGSETITTPSGATARFYYPTVAQQRGLQVSFGGCTFAYRMPDSIENYAALDTFDGVVVAQLESDGRLYLIPPTSTSAAAPGTVTALQKDGFPVSPIEKRCQPARP